MSLLLTFGHAVPASYVYWEKKFKFVNREERIGKNIKTLVKHTFCDSNFLQNLFFQFVTVIQLEIFASKGQNPKFSNSKLLTTKFPKSEMLSYLQQLRRTLSTSIFFY